MATQRYISTSFWDDEWVQSLDSIEKLLYLYFLTNPLTNIAGVYKITRKRITFDTGIENGRLEEILRKFADYGKAYLNGEYMVIPAWPEHQKPKQRSKVDIGIRRILEKLDKNLLGFMIYIGYRYDIKGYAYDVKGYAYRKNISYAYDPISYTYDSNYSDSDSDLDLDLADKTCSEELEIPPHTPSADSTAGGKPVDNSEDDFDDPFLEDFELEPPQPEDSKSEHQQLVDLLHELYEKSTGSKYAFKAVDGRHLKNLRAKIGFEQLREKLIAYFERDWWFTKDGRRDVMGFVNHINEITHRGPNPEPTSEELQARRAAIRAQRGDDES